MNKIVVIGLFILAAVLSVFFTCLMYSSYSEIAQALGTLAGSAIGVIGAFGVALWTFKQEEQKELKKYVTEKNLIKRELKRYAEALEVTINDILPRFDFVDEFVLPLLAHLKKRELDYHTFTTEEIAMYEELHEQIEEMHKRIADIEAINSKSVIKRNMFEAACILIEVRAYDTLRQHVYDTCTLFGVSNNRIEELSKSIFDRGMPIAAEVFRKDKQDE